MNFAALPHALDLAAATVWRNSGEATVLIGLVAAVQFLFRRGLPPRWRYALGLLVVIRLALPVVPGSSWSLFNLGNLRWRTAPAVPVSTQLAIPEETALATTPLSPTSPLSPLPVATAAPAPVFRFQSILSWLWLTGVLVMLGKLARQHHRFARDIRLQPTVTEPRMLELLARCQAEMKVLRPLPLIALPGLTTPALFGFWRPRLLVPPRCWETLDDSELRMIFQHELTHLRRGDLLLNGLMLLLRALHWFNPAVWLAFRRLRADQELACDAAVIAALPPEDRRLYGHTLLKLLDVFPPAGLGPSLVPFLTRKSVLQRRIHMIARFQPASRLALFCSLALFTTLGCLTLTRAADTNDENPKPATPQEKPAAPAPPTATTKPKATAPATEPNRRQVDALEMVLQEALAENNARMIDTKERIKHLSRELGVTYEPGSGVKFPGTDAESLRQFQSLQTQSEISWVQKSTLFEGLRKLPPEKLRQALPTAMPDELLHILMQDLLTAENKLVALRSEYGESHPDVIRTRNMVKDLNAKIDQRVEGIMIGADLQVASLRAQSDSTREKLKTARQASQDASSATQSFNELQHELEFLQKAQDSLKMRLQELRIEKAVNNRTDTK